MHMSFCLPGPLRTTCELTNLRTGVEKYARCGYTNATCPQLAKTAPKHHITCFDFHISSQFHHFQKLDIQKQKPNADVYGTLFKLLFCLLRKRRKKRRVNGGA